MPIAEEDECDDDDDEAEAARGGPSQTRPAEVPISIAVADIPQAFSHFTYRCSRREMLVCDLQGVLDEAASPPLFELTDPVIHYASRSGRQNVYGRTDRGKKGINSFLKTHVCSDLCRALQRRWEAHEELCSSLAGGLKL